MDEARTWQSWLLAFIVCGLVTAACILYVDRPLAEFFELHTQHSTLWVAVDRAFPIFDAVVVAALLFLIACGIRVLSGHPLSSWTQTPLLCSWSAMWAVSADIIFKQIFGRLGPDAAYVQYNHYGFHPFQTRLHWAAFPSGTAAVSAAVVSVLFAINPRSRVVGLFVVVLLSAMVVIMNYHWMSDVIAGAFLGVFIGSSTVRLWLLKSGD